VAAGAALFLGGAGAGASTVSPGAER
jgi:hypothetical protein